MVEDGLEKEGIETLIHHLTPPNDGGIALGQVLAGMCTVNADNDEYLKETEGSD